MSDMPVGAATSSRDLVEYVKYVQVLVNVIDSIWFADELNC